MLTWHIDVEALLGASDKNFLLSVRVQNHIQIHVALRLTCSMRSFSFSIAQVVLHLNAPDSFKPSCK